MWWPFRRRPALPEAPPILGERVAQLESDTRQLRRALDDLDDNLRAFKGRVFKRQAREEGSDDASPVHAPPGPVVLNGSGSVTALKAAGKWPYRR